jgi:hypothetical protein
MMEMVGAGHSSFRGLFSNGSGHFSFSGQGSIDLTQLLQYEVSVCPDQALLLLKEIVALQSQLDRASAIGAAEWKFFDRDDHPGRRDKKVAMRVKNLVKQLPEGFHPISNGWLNGELLYDNWGNEIPGRTIFTGRSRNDTVILLNALNGACSGSSIRPSQLEEFMKVRAARASLLLRLLASDLSVKQRETVQQLSDRGEKTFLYVSQFNSGLLLAHTHYGVVSRKLKEVWATDRMLWPSFQEKFETWHFVSTGFFLTEEGSEIAKKLNDELALKMSDLGELTRFYLPLN